MGFAMLVGCGGWIGPMWGQFLSLSWYLTYPPQNNHFGSKWSHAAQQWQKCVNTTINWYSRTVFVIVWWSLTNVAAYNIRLGCNFYTTKSAATDGDGCGESEGTNNNIQNEHISWIWYMRRIWSAYCNDWQCLGSTIYIYHGKMRYHEIHQNHINDVIYFNSDPHRTNPIQHNNQLTYGSNKWWRFWVWNRFNEWYVVFCCFCTYKN